ncbi:MAG: translation initiation factor IF-2 N-terminal domain-containing protein, partial [Bacteroidota bacterium]|nr:translation initiation factor IF-2 N-terminal domain-containing protein [Bacteroidota bacterium]
ETPKKVEEVKVEKTVAEVIEEKPRVVTKHEVKEKKHHEVAKPEVIEEKAQVIFQVDHSDNEVMTTNVPKVEEVKVVGRIDLDLLNQKTRPAKKSKRQKEDERKDRDRARRDSQQPAEKENIVQKETTDSDRTPPTVIKARAERLSGPTVVGRIELPSDKKPALSEAAQQQARNKKKRKRISKDIPGTQQRVNTVDKPVVAGERRKLVVTKNIGGTAPAAGGGSGGSGGDRSKLKKRPLLKKEVSEEDVQKQIKDTLARLTTKGTKSKGSKYRKDKRQLVSDKAAAQQERDTADHNILKVTEYVSVNELATMMDASVTAVISTCMSLGLFVSINQRLDAETMAIVADEFGFKVEFVSAEIQV